MSKFNVNVLWAIVLPMAIAACGGGASTPPPIIQPQPTFRQLATIMGQATPATLLIQSEAEWFNAFKGAPYAAPASGANFQTESVLLAGIGMRPNGATIVKFISVVTGDDKITANVEVATCVDGVSVNIVTYPATAVAIPKTSKEVVFAITQAQHC